MRITIYLMLIITWMIIGCEPSGKEKESGYDEARDVYDQAMVIHDEVMPEMGRLMSLQKSLRTRLEETEDDVKRKEIEQAIEDLEKAHDAMMSWMRNLTRIPEPGDLKESEPEDLPGPQEMLEIQQESLKEIRDVKQKMESSRQKAEEMLE